MKAVQCKAYGPVDALVIEDVPALRAGRTQVVLEVKACGVNFMDNLMVQGKYQFKPPVPFSPGSEVSGIVKHIGSDVRHVQVGDSAMAYASSGGFAEEMLVEASEVVSMPAHFDFVTAASFPMVYGTAYYALKDRADLKPGETLLVLGAAGGVGLAALQLAKAMGARTIAGASSEEKLAACREQGADVQLNYGRQDWKEELKRLTSESGVDVVFDPVGGDYAEPALRAMAWNGRYLVIGFATGNIPKIPLNLVLLKGCSLVGVFWGAWTKRAPQRSRVNWQDLFAWTLEGKLRPHVCAVYPLERVQDALKRVARREVIGKVVLTTGL